MAWRLTRAEFDRQRGAPNKRALKRIVRREVPGLLAYLGDQPVGWCAIQPREAYASLERARVLKRVDEAPVWSVTCFFIAKPYRRQGVSVALLRAAITHAGRNGATIVEGYPVEPKQGWPDVFAWTGTVAAFRRAGFVEVLRRSPTRPIMRYYIRTQ